MSNPSSSPASGQPDRVSAWSLIRPYWVSEERRTAWGLLITIIVMDLLVVGINARLNTWNRDFYNALEGKNVRDFPQLMLLFTALAFAFVALSVYNRYLRQMLGFRWRQWLTTRYVQEWLGDGTFYRIERDRLTDNPDQRIAVDLESFANTTLSLTLDLLSTLETLVWFSTVLWSTAGALAVVIGGTPVQIPGYMLWAAIAYAIAGSILTNKVGHPLVSINYQMQRVEADFRFGLIRLRENAEQIAFYDGMRAEASTAQDLFGRIRENWWRVMKYTRRYSFVLNFYGQIAEIFPIVVASPRYFAGALSFGTLMQIADAFGSVSDSLSWFINNYDTLVQWRATVNRLREFKRVMQQPHLKESVSPAHRAWRHQPALCRREPARHAQPHACAAQRRDARERARHRRQARFALARARAVRLGQEHAVARAGGSLAVRKRLDRRTGERAHDVHPAAELSAGRRLEGCADLSLRSHRLQRRRMLRSAASLPA